MPVVTPRTRAATSFAFSRIAQLPGGLHGIAALHAFAEYLLLCTVLRWRMSAHTAGLHWYAIPVALVPWLLMRWPEIRRAHGATPPCNLRRWSESHASGLMMSSGLMNLFFAMPLDRLPAFVGWALGTMIAWEFTINRGAWLVVSSLMRRGWNRLWPRGGEVLVTLLAVWIWARLTQPSGMPVPVYAWVAGSSGTVVWLSRRWSSPWRWIPAPAIALTPLLLALAGTPLGQPAGRLALLAVLAFAGSAAHGCSTRVRGARSAEVAWLWVLGLTGLWLGEPLLNAQATGAGDAHWYTMVMADAIYQFRVGLFPPLIGQSQYAFNGSSFPGCFAPYYQMLGLAVHGLSAGTLSVFAVQHLTAILSILGGIFSAYGVLRALTHARRAPTALLAILYAASPAWLGAIYSMDMYMTLMTLPWLPLVFFGCVLTFIRLDARSLLWLVLPLAMVWYAHPPVALWATLAVAASQGFRLTSRRNIWRTEAQWLRQAGALFFALTCLPFATTYFAEPNVDAFRTDYVVKTLGSHWMAAWRPVSDGADRLSDQQLGWSLAAVALLGGVWAFSKNQRALSSIMAAASTLLILLIPLPLVQSALWNKVPSAIKSVTNNWPTQRLYPVLAAAVTVACGTAMLRVMRRRRTASRWMTAGLCLAVTWSLVEASKFQRRTHLSTLTPEASERQLYPENLTLTRYAYEMFKRKPDYVADGVMSPLMQHRLLDATSMTEITSNAAAMRSWLSDKNLHPGEPCDWQWRIPAHAINRTSARTRILARVHVLPAGLSR